MPVHETDVLCPVCKSGKVQVDVGMVTDTHPTQIPIGPGARDYYYPKIISIHCNNDMCANLFHRVPGKPNLGPEIVSMVRSQQELDD